MTAAVIASPSAGLQSRQGVGTSARPGVLSLAIKEKAALYAAMLERTFVFVFADTDCKCCQIGSANSRAFFEGTLL